MADLAARLRLLVLAREFAVGDKARVRRQQKWVKVTVMDKNGGKLLVKLPDGSTKRYAPTSLRGSKAIYPLSLHALPPMTHNTVKQRSIQQAKSWRKPVIDDWHAATGGSLYFHIDRNLPEESRQEFASGLRHVAEWTKENAALRHVVKNLRIIVRQPSKLDREFHGEDPKYFAYADYDSRSIVFNGNHWSQDGVKANLERQATLGFLANPSDGGTLVHEVGHLLHFYTKQGSARKYPELMWLRQRMNDLYTQAAAGKIKLPLSHYALSNEDEFFAEAFSAAVYGLHAKHPAVKLMTKFLRNRL